MPLPQTVLLRNSNEWLHLSGNLAQPVKALRTFSLLFLLFILQLYNTWTQRSTMLDVVKYMQYNITSVLKSLHYPCEQDRTSYCEKGKDAEQTTAR